MPYEFDIQSRLYKTPDGNFVFRTVIRSLIDDLLTTTGRDAGKIAAKFDAGEITATEFNLAMRELLKSAHIVASTVGRGGKAAMTASDWGRIGKKLQWQYGYLDKFTRKLEQGTLKAANTASRAKSYISSVYISYADSIQETIKDAPPLDPNGDKILVRLVQNSKEGCDECTADAAEGWMQPEDMGEIGSRICGDWCLCELEFSDEV